MSQITLSDIPQDFEKKLGTKTMSYASFVKAFSSYENADFIDFRQEDFDALPKETKIAYFTTKLELERNGIDSFSSISEQHSWNK